MMMGGMRQMTMGGIRRNGLVRFSTELLSRWVIFESMRLPWLLRRISLTAKLAIRMIAVFYYA